MRKKIIIAGILCLTATCNSQAEELEKAKTNPDAIPPVITLEDTDLDLTAEQQIILLNRKKADWLLKDIKIGGKQIPSSYDKKIEQLQREKFDASPRQTIPLKDCIKPNNVIDNDVQECLNGRIEKSW
ncbi:hypothetical protein [Cellvibrio sp. PSBB006]|uniref:hypothetical protein n=1 Tax=Cellvibrio sp. PSBB006 TaxID=1987723 RepID=UPI000B3B4BDE|nr:hypothetical protein [Cellvibrio sp. PSBB006]ARU29069.1 hypothetical protein CBR65_17390 [Cellvibrio sp. PSBB006]